MDEWCCWFKIRWGYSTDWLSFMLHSILVRVEQCSKSTSGAWMIRCHSGCGSVEWGGGEWHWMQTASMRNVNDASHRCHGYIWWLPAFDWWWQHSVGEVRGKWEVSVGKIEGKKQNSHRMLVVLLLSCRGTNWRSTSTSSLSQLQSHCWYTTQLTCFWHSYIKVH